MVRVAGLKQQKDAALLRKQIGYLTNFMNDPLNEALVEEMQIPSRIEKAKESLNIIDSSKYLDDLVGTIGADPLFTNQEKK